MQKNYHKEIRGLSIQVRNDDVNGALRKLKKKVQEDGKLQDLRNREYFEKPTSRRKRAKAAARSRHLKKLEKEQRDLEKSRNR